jgi:hypothetical protein
MDSKAAFNPIIESRLAGMRKMVLAGYESGEALSSATKGHEREAFVNGFLSQVFSTSYRFGTGDITSTDNIRSGQVDIVVESPFWYSLPAFPEGPRLYMAEGVAAVIEVKSDLTKQWDEAVATADKVKQVKRRYDHHICNYLQAFITEINEILKTIEPTDPSRKMLENTRTELVRSINTKYLDSYFIPANFAETIPCYVVGFKTWKQLDTIERKLLSTTSIDGVVCLDAPAALFKNGDNSLRIINDELMLMVFLDTLMMDLSAVSKMNTPQYNNYASKQTYDAMRRMLQEAKEDYVKRKNSETANAET